MVGPVLNMEKSFLHEVLKSLAKYPKYWLHLSQDRLSEPMLMDCVSLAVPWLGQHINRELT